MYETLAILAAFVFLYSTVGGGLERTPINGALVFTAFGLLFGPLGLDLLDLDVGAEGLDVYNTILDAINVSERLGPARRKMQSVDAIRS